MEGPRDIKSFIIPAPTGGLNYKDPLPSMGPDTAISMSNLIPNGATVDVRGALKKWAEVGTATSLYGLFTYNCPDGGSYLIGLGIYLRGSVPYYAIYDLTSSTATPININILSSAYTYTDYAPLAINFGGYLFIATGAYVGGTSDVAALIRVGKPTGVGRTFQSSDVTCVLQNDSPVTSSDYYNPWATVGSYKERIYCACAPHHLDGSTTQSIYYSNTKQITGAMPPTNVYDVSYLTQMGGKIIYASSVTRQEGSLAQSLFAVVTENGEVLVFTGSYPGSPTWEIVGYYIIPKPLGKRAFFYIGSNLYIITVAGIFAFSDLTSNYGSEQEIALRSDYINNKFPEYASYALTLNSLTQGITSWYGAYSSKENKVFVGYPESPSTYGMLVQDLTTKGWGQLNYQNQVAGITVFKDQLYGFSPASYTYTLQQSASGDDVFRGGKWSSWPISISAQLAANYNDDFSTTKQFSEIKALVQCKSPYSITAGLAVDFDLRSAGYNNYSKVTGGTYGLYQPRFSTGDRENVGKCCIINLGGQFNAADLPMKFVAFEVYYTDAGNY